MEATYHAMIRIHRNIYIEIIEVCFYDIDIASIVSFHQCQWEHRISTISTNESVPLCLKLPLSTSQLGAVGDITASTDEDVDQIIEDVEADRLNVDKVGER